MFTSVAFMLSLTGAALADEPADAALAELRERHVQVFKQLGEAERLKRHHHDVIRILQYMPENARKALSLNRMGFYEDGRIDLRPMAKADLDAGRIIFLEAGGLPNPWLAEFHKWMKKKYGVIYIDFGLGCVTDLSVRKSVDEYNAVVEEFIRKKHPGFDEQKEFEAFIAEREKKNKRAEP